MDFAISEYEGLSARSPLARFLKLRLTRYWSRKLPRGGLGRKLQASGCVAPCQLTDILKLEHEPRRIDLSEAPSGLISLLLHLQDPGSFLYQFVF